MHTFKKYLMGIYYISNTVPMTVDAVVNKTEHSWSLGTYSPIK